MNTFIHYRTEFINMTLNRDIFELRKFVAPELVFGVGARHLAGQYVKNFQTGKILLVTDSGVLRTSSFEDVRKSLDDSGIAYTIFSDIQPNPRADSVMKGAEQYVSGGCMGILVIGGGSAIDCAKGIGIVSSNKKHILEFEGVDQIRIPAPPLICIPTTSGSSADVSQFAIITDPKRKIKIAIISKALVPDIALIDPETLLSLPSDLTLHTVLDTLTHAIEAYVSNAHSSMTDIHALEAVRLVTRYLPYTIKYPDNLEYRVYTMLASMHAGLAFSNASLGAVHAMAHSLGGLLDLPHGMCNGLLLPAVISFNYDAVPDRYDQIGGAMGIRMDDIRKENRKTAILDHLKAFYQELGFSVSLKDMGVDPAMIHELAIHALADPCMVTNPQQPGLDDIESIYESA